jgi:hypothetical protein
MPRISEKILYNLLAARSDGSKKGSFLPENGEAVFKLF